ncbi:hypothetical protein [Microvirga sp. M2]|uniref:hypothetical protein n=1 Tax=Microvirga sp. M2 TaxID=3073270 RepID=UPI0039C3FC55
MHVHLVDRIDVDAGVGSLSLSVAQAAAWARTDIVFTGADTISVRGTNAELQALTPAQIVSLAEKGVDAIVCTDVGLTISVAQAIALASTVMALSDNNVVGVLGDTGELKTLGVNVLTQLSTKGVDFLASTTGTNIFDLARFNALGGIRLTDTDMNRLEASGQVIAALTIDDIGRLRTKGIDILFANNGDLALSLAQLNALGSLNVGSTTDVMVLRDTADTLKALTTDQIGQLGAKGIDRIDVNEGSLGLSLDQAAALALTNIVFANEDTVSLTGLGANLKTLTPAQIAALNRNGFDKIDATDNQLSLSVGQAAALVETSIVFAADDVVKLIDTKLNLESLTADQITALGAQGLDIIDCSPEAAFSFSKEQAEALLATSIALSGDDTVTLTASEGVLQDFLTPERIADLNVKGFDKIHATGGSLALSANAAAALAGTSIMFTEGDVVTLFDTALALAGLTPDQLRLLGAKGLDVVDSFNDNLALSVQQAEAVAGTGISFTTDGAAGDDDVVVKGFSADFAALLDADEIAALAAKGVDSFDSRDDLIVFTLAQFNALGGIALTAADVTKVRASGEAFAALTSDQFAAFAAKGIDSIVVDDGDLILSVAQFNALGPVGLEVDDAVILRGDAAALLLLDAAMMQRLADKGVDRIESTDAAFSLSVGAAAVLAGTAIALGEGNTVTVTGAPGDLQLTPAQIGQLAAKGVDVIDATGDNADMTLSVAQAVALAATATMTLSAGDKVTVLGDVADLRTLSDTQITRLGEKGVDVLDATGNNAAMILSFAQAVALAATESMKMSAGDHVTLLADAVDLVHLSTTQITRLGAKGVDVIDASGVNVALNLTIDQARALADTPIVLANDDDVTLALTAAELQTLTGAQINALLGKGVDHITVTNPNNETLFLTVAQLEAVAGLDLSAFENIVLRDTGAKLGSLSVSKIAQIAEWGIDSVDAGNDILVLNLAQLNAFRQIGLTENDSITLLDTSAWLVELTADQIRALDVQGVDRLNVLDDEWRMTIAQAKALAATDIGLFATDEVILKGTAAEVATLTAADIIALGRKNLDMIDVSDNAATLSAAQAAALASTASLKFSAGDAVTVSDTGDALAALTPAQIGALAAKGIDALDASDNRLKLSVAQFGMLGDVGLTAGDVVTLADTGGTLSALSAAQIGALAAKGIDALDASDDRLKLSIAQLGALGELGLTPGDTVTLADTGAALSALTAAQMGALVARGVDAVDASDNRIDLSLEQFNALRLLTLAAEDVVRVQGTSSANVFVSQGNSGAFFGLGGNDRLTGGSGNDTLDGGIGRDVLTGGTGQDTFVFRDRPASANYDTITDYNKALDSIQLDNKYMAKLGGPGRLSSSKFVVGKVAKDGNDHLIYDKGTGKLYYDPDGSGSQAQVLIAQFTNKVALTASEFTII